MAAVLETRNPWRDAALCGVAAAGLGAAIQVRDGLYHPFGFVCLSIALLAGLLIYLPATFEPLDNIGPTRVRWIFAAAVVLNFCQWFTPHRLPGSWHGTSASPMFYAGLLAAFLISIVMIAKPALARVSLIVLIVVFCALGAWIIIRVPTPYMDVWMLQTEGLRAFVHGHNPFNTPFVDVYHRPELYLGERDAHGLVHQGFPYPPMVLWMELPGYLLGGDYRWSNLGAMALTAILIGYSSRNAIAPLAAALFLFTPRALFVLESGWTEPITALLLAATVFCAARLPRLTGVCLGLFLCSKQYLVWAVPPIVLLAPRSGRLIRMMIVALVIGCAASLPLILWDVRAFFAANMEIAHGVQFRTDALSYLALFANNTRITPSGSVATIIGVGIAVIVTILACFRGSRTPAGYAAAVATAHLAFFSFYKFAFCNYDWFLIAAFCAAAGVTGSFVPESTFPEFIQSWQSDLQADRTARA